MCALHHLAYPAGLTLASFPSLPRPRCRSCQTIADAGKKDTWCMNTFGEVSPSCSPRLNNQSNRMHYSWSAAGWVARRAAGWWLHGQGAAGSGHHRLMHV